MRGRGWALAGLLVAVTANGAPGKQLWTEAKQRRVSAQRSDLVQVARRAMPAVVSLTTEQLGEAGAGAPDAAEGSQRGLGAGFIIHPDGYILTASHVIEHAAEIRATVIDAQGNPREYAAEVVGQDIPTDFAILKIHAGQKLPVLPLGSAEHVDVADWVVAIGNPFGLGHSVTVGVVSYKGRADIAPNGREGYFDYLQTDASINPGNSGGPVMDLSGEVVAIANAVNVAGQGIGFAIPIDIAKAVIPQLMERGSMRRGWMGASVQDLTPELAESFGVRGFEGVVVSDVVAGGPGGAAGLRPGDIIQGFDTRPVTRAHALRWQVASAGVGRTVALKVRRDGRPVAVQVTLTDLPGESAEVSLPGAARVDATTPVSRREPELFGLKLEEGASRGAKVQQVAQASAGARAGLAAGDVVLQANSASVASRAELLSALGGAARGSLIRLFVQRGERTLYLALRKP